LFSGWQFYDCFKFLALGWRASFIEVLYFFVLKNTAWKGVKQMPLSESIPTALFCMAVVFAVLILLWAIIRIFSQFIEVIEKIKLKKIQKQNIKTNQKQ
jgi:Na+-transporting methylmalonyl-CoA/oxaloacetate decarboxylase gamma subunit